MTAATVADLLAGWLAPLADSAPTPAKAANPANRKDSCGPPADNGACEGLRIAANPAPEPPDGPDDSQTFAALRSGSEAPQSKHSCGVSQDSQLSQGWPMHMHARTCAGCTHRLPRGTCAKPEAAGLFPPGHGFGIAWPDEGHAESCVTFAPREATAAQPGRRYRLTQAEGDEAHAEPWMDADIGRFNDRTVAIRRRGFAADDADDLAERLHLRDVHADDRHLCLECRHLAGTVPMGWRCGNHKAAAVARELSAELVTTLQRCQASSTAGTYARDEDNGQGLHPTGRPV